jgi:hypothetical protein
LAGNLVKPLLSLYGTEWRERGYGLRSNSVARWIAPKLSTVATGNSTPVVVAGEQFFKWADGRKSQVGNTC